jgi:hypothetical protein
MGVRIGLQSSEDRLRDQIKVLVFYGTVYEDIEEYKRNYELDDAGMAAWAKEAKEIMGVPMHLNYRFERMPKNQLPATLAVLAGNRQGHDKGHRLYRALLRRSIVEEQDVTRETVILEAVKEAGLDGDNFERDWADQTGLKADLERQGEGVPSVHVGFYNIAVTDLHGRSVYLDQQFQPSVVEGAIDYLADGKLKKAKPADLLSYLKLQGPTPLVEVERVFGLPSAEARTKLEKVEKVGKAKGTTLAGDSFWSA